MRSGVRGSLGTRDRPRRVPPGLARSGRGGALMAADEPRHLAISGCWPPGPAGKIARMPAQLIRAGDLYQGAPYAYAAVAPPGSLIFTAGACPINAEGVVTAPGEYAVQAGQTVANLITALAAAGASLADVLKTTVYVAS